MTQRLTVPLTIYRALMAHALREAPWECCGLLGGVGEEVRSCHPLTNRALTPQTRYFASPEDLFPAMRLLREAGETLLAIYHSHPDGVPFPSETDLELAFYPQTVYLIMGPLQAGSESLSTPPGVRGFLLGRRDILEVEIVLGGQIEDRRQILVDLLPQFGSAHPSEPDLEGVPGSETACSVPPVVPLDEGSEEAQTVIATVDDLPEEAAVEPAPAVQEEVAPVDDLPEEAAVEPALVVPEEFEPVDDLPEEAAVEPAPVVPEEVAPVDDLPEEAAVEPALVVQEEFEPVDDLPEEAAVEPAPVVPEEVAPIEDLPEEAPVEPVPVVQEEVEPVDDLPEGTSEGASQVAQEAVDSIEDLPDEPSDGAPRELVVEEIPPVAEPVPEAPSRLADEEGEGGAGAPEEVGEGWASRITRKIRSAIVRVARWAFSGRDRQ
jgi:proteasome lid subunit RPN8/RPN11